MNGGNGSSGVGELEVHTVSTGNSGTPANTNETLLKSAVIASGTLSADGKRISFKAWGSFANNANLKTVRVRFGPVTLTGTALMTKGPVAFQNSSWEITGEIVRSSSGNQSCNAVWKMTLAAADSNHMQIVPTTIAQSDNQDLRLEVTGQNGTASANDIVCSGLIADVEAAP